MRQTKSYLHSWLSLTVVRLRQEYRQKVRGEMEEYRQKVRSEMEEEARVRGVCLLSINTFYNTFIIHSIFFELGLSAKSAPGDGR